MTPKASTNLLTFVKIIINRYGLVDEFFPKLERIGAHCFSYSRHIDYSWSICWETHCFPVNVAYIIIINKAYQAIILINHTKINFSVELFTLKYRL